jgi:hypothetical protein
MAQHSGFRENDDFHKTSKPILMTLKKNATILEWQIVAGTSEKSGEKRGDAVC